MPEFNNGKYQRAVDAMYSALESIPGLELGNPEARRWIASYAVSLGLDVSALCRMLMALGIQQLRVMREEELDTIAAVTGKGLGRVAGCDEPVW